MADFKDTHN